MRARINRWTPARRNLVFDDDIRTSLVQPHFVVAGKDVDQPIPSMPGINRQSVDVLLKTIDLDMKMGLFSHMLFLVLDAEKKDPTASFASNANSPLHEAIRALKKKYGGEIVIMTDLCLCTGTDHGHCGVIKRNNIENDETVEHLVKIGMSHAKAGSDYISASDMMDGRIERLRGKLEEEGYHSTGLMSYSVKYASSFYGPFRDAAESSPEFGDRRSHQMDIRSGYSEAVMQARNDQSEGADILMVKPGLPYLDVLRKVADAVVRPVAVYNVSGEYSMVMETNKNLLQRALVVREIFNSFKRAGADIIVSYHAREAITENWI
ncbi:MAG: porphobilinogen synthase [Euryarchaeota archaeon]|nr:porphobilinogen synthase [Euryarchaeota archaeon]